MNFIKMGYEKSKWNEAFIDFCGHNETQCFNTELVSFNPCCELYALICPSYALFAVISAFYISSEKNVKRTNFQSIIVKTRILITFLLLVTFLTCISTCIPDLFSDKRWVYILTSCVAILAYVIHIVFLCNLTKRISLHCRGPTAVICAWLLNSLAIFIHIRSVFLSENPSTIKDKEKVFSYVFAVLLTLYLLTLIPNSVGTLIRVQNHLLTVNIEDAERTSLLHSGSYSESYIEQISSPVWSDLGVALDDSNIFSRLTFSWVNSLMHKGNKKLLLTVDSLYELPHGLRTSFLDTKFWILYKDLQLRATSQLLPVSSTETSEQFPEMEKAKVSLLRTLISCFGVEFFMLGIMKFISDSLSFSGPLLLNLLLTNLDHSSQSVNSYYYALGLFLATFLNAILSSQFQFLMGNLSLKIRAAIITTVFRKSLSVNLSGMAKLSTGEIVNFMSTDTDRIQNICPSFHQLWSLPLQIAVCLYLLHDQVKNAILAGIAFAVMLIPINHLIAKKIAKLSIIMMEQKDKRVKLMSEILSGIQVIKFNAWEDHFSKWIGIYRNKEIKALKGRKYLDAACVYFWATTPVMITLLTFVTYLFWYKEPLTSAQVKPKIKNMLMDNDIATS